VNPTAEAVAKHIATEMATRIPSQVSIRSVRVTEAPGCSARYVLS
jgi:6-pyruvoyl-tetrahydropterin synthase